MVFGELVLKFFSQVPGVGRAITVRADSNLQRAAFDDSRNEEIAQVRLVNDITKNFKLLTVFVDAAIQVEVIGCGDGENGFSEVILRIGAYDNLYMRKVAGFFEGGINRFGDNDDPCTGFVQGVGFSGGDGACTNDHDAFAGEIKIYRVPCHHLRLYRLNEGRQ